MRSRIWLAICLAVFGWGSSGVANRAALLEGADAYTIIALRFMMAVVVLFAYFWLSQTAPTRRPEIWWRGGLLGLVGMVIPTLLFTLALNHISTGLNGIIIGLIAIATVVWAHFILEGERLDWRVIGGMLVGLSGVVTLVLSGETGIADGGNLMRGGSLTLGGVVVGGLGSALSRKYMLRYSILDFAGPQFVVGAAVGLLAWPVFGHFDLDGFTLEIWLLITYVGVVGTTVPFLAFLWASRLGTATRVAVVGYLTPLISLSGGIIFLDEQLAWLMALGGALIATGVLIVDRVEASRRSGASTLGAAGANG
jgi:drug/metabolite transporter (DMT)-like permease